MSRSEAAAGMSNNRGLRKGRCVCAVGREAGYRGTGALLQELTWKALVSEKGHKQNVQCFPFVFKMLLMTTVVALMLCVSVARERPLNQCSHSLSTYYTFRISAMTQFIIMNMYCFCNQKTIVFKGGESNTQVDQTNAQKGGKASTIKNKSLTSLNATVKGGRLS